MDIDSFRPGIYRHYKHTEQSPRYYQVLGVARNTETDELFALYVPLYVIAAHKGVRFQIRSLVMFFEQVEYKGKLVDRFTYIGQQLH